MTDAYVNVILEPGGVPTAVEVIGALEEVDAAHTVTGEFDAVARLELESKEEIPRVVPEEIHGVSGVVDTVTNVAFSP
jgi:DNA-binding Lrp family transcriptional regulator